MWAQWLHQKFKSLLFDVQIHHLITKRMFEKFARINFTLFLLSICVFLSINVFPYTNCQVSRKPPKYPSQTPSSMQDEPICTVHIPPSMETPIMPQFYH